MRCSAIGCTSATPPPEPHATNSTETVADARLYPQATTVVEARPRVEAPTETVALEPAPTRFRDIEIYPGRFPGGRTHVIFASHTTGPSDEQTILSALMFVKAGGAIEFVEQADVLGEMSFFALTDLDADGRDEIVFEDAYHEGWYIEMVHWPRGKPKTRVLTGDGL